MTIEYSDTFTAANGTLLSAHTSDTSDTYTAGATFEIQGNELITASGTGTVIANVDATQPYTTDYAVRFDLIVGVSATAKHGMAACLQATNGTLYFCRFDPSTDEVQLYKTISGAGSTSLGAWSYGARGSEVTISVAMFIETTGVRVEVDGTERITSSNTEITRNGDIGFRFFGNSGVALDNAEFDSDPASGPAVTQTDTAPEDGVQQSFTTTGLTGTITAASLGGKDILSLLSNTDPTTATTYTLDVSATTTSIGQPRVGETSTLSVTATGGTATTDVVIQPKTGWTTVTLAGTLDKTASGFLHSLDADLGLTSAVGDIIYYSNARGEAITATGVYTGGTTVAYQSTAFVIQQGGSATTTATSEGDAFYPFGEAPAGTGTTVKSINLSSIRIGL